MAKAEFGSQAVTQFASRPYYCNSKFILLEQMNSPFGFRQHLLFSLNCTKNYDEIAPKRSLRHRPTAGFCCYFFFCGVTRKPALSQVRWGSWRGWLFSLGLPPPA